MAGWDRYGEDKKYRKDVDVNDNPKHVGEPLRKLTLEDRLEIRRQVREQQKKRVHTAEINEDLESDDVDLSTSATTPSKRPKVGTKATSPEEVADGELDIIGVASNGKKRNEVVDLADEDATQSRAAAIRRARRKAKAKAAKAKGKASAPEVEVLE